MGPVEAIRSGFQRAVDFRGRSTRPEYWWWSLMTYVITLLVGDRPSTLEALALLALFVPSLAVTFRRLHDTDRSAWNLMWLVVPVLGVIAVFVFLVQRGTPTSNRYGPPPQGTAGPVEGWDVPPPPPSSAD